MTTKTLRDAVVTAMCVVLIGSPLGAAAQAPAAERPTTSGRGFFMAGYQRLGLRGLNRDLGNAGYPALERHYLTLGGAGLGTRGRFLIGGEGHALLGGNETTAGGALQLSTSGGFGLFRVGYLAVSSATFDLYPLLGIGGGGMGLKIIERDAPTFDEVLADPGRSSSLDTGMFLLDVSLAANYRIDMREGDDGPGGFLLGVHVGYTFAPGDTSWKLDGINSVAGGPTLQIEGPYVRVSIGGWGSERDDDEP
jgi:hypothetical protein